MARLAAATPVWMGATIKVVVRYARAFWREAGLSGAAVSHVGPLREIHDMSGLEGDPAVLFGFAESGLGSDRRETVLRQLVRLFGPEAADPLGLEVVDWSRERWTSPPQADRSRRFELYGHPLYQEPIHGRIHFASTETAPAFGGHIEGALMAAEAVVERLLASAASDYRTRTE
jgi:monoamine oxidase